MTHDSWHACGAQRRHVHRHMRSAKPHASRESHNPSLRPKHHELAIALCARSAKAPPALRSSWRPASTRPPPTGTGSRQRSRPHLRPRSLPLAVLSVTEQPLAGDPEGAAGRTASALERQRAAHGRRCDVRGFHLKASARTRGCDHDSPGRRGRGVRRTPRICLTDRGTALRVSFSPYPLTPSRSSRS